MATSITIRRRKIAAALFAAVVLGALPANVRAARPLLDKHQWDGYFALFGRDGAVANKRIGVRLDTYSGAPVDFAAFAVDPADVLVAGAAGRPRAIDTTRRSPVVRWKFTPPPGYQLESNDVDVPLQNREGFYVVEARRGDAVQQVWVNVSRIGLVAKESPDGVLLYATDLTNGKPLVGLRVQFLVNASFADATTDANGIARYAGAGRPQFALARLGSAQGFIAFAPQAPVPGTVLGMRLDRGSVRAGERVRVVGFVRRHAGPTYAPATGDVRIVLSARGRTIGQQTAKPDASGAFEAEMTVPLETPAGDVAVLATAGAASSGASLHIDASGEATVTVRATCGSSCAANRAVSLEIVAKRAGLPIVDGTVRVRVVRSPHIVPPGANDDLVRFGTTAVVDARVTTNADGIAKATIPAPTDGLASTYGVTALLGGTTATARFVATSARLALAVEPASTQLDVGEAASVAIDGFDANDGTPIGGTSVTVRIAHGPQVQERVVRLDANGRARVTFPAPNLGANFVTAEATDADGNRALDAAAIVVAPQSLATGASRGASDIAIELDRARYKPGESVGVHAQLEGGVGSALVTLEGPRVYATRTVALRDGRIDAHFAIPPGFGTTSVGVAVVRNGAIVYGSVPVVVDGPGQPRATSLTADRAAYAPGELAHIKIRDNATKAATLFVRLADGRPTRGAGFDEAPNALASAGTTTHANVSDPSDWHAWVAPARSKAGDVFGFDRPRSTVLTDTTLAVAAPKPVYWKVERTDRETIDLTMPTERGRYVLSLLKVYPDGDVGAASLSLVVQ